MKFLTSFVALATTMLCLAQPPIKFGKPEMSELQMTVYEHDSSAAAVVLCDYGSSKIDYIGDEFQLIFQRTIRIKILKKEGLKWANHIINFYTPKSGQDEKIGTLKGWTFSLVDGKLEKTKLDRDGIFEVRNNEYWSQQKITFPKVREGSVIDLYYTSTSPYIRNYQDWYFQKEIPVKWSEYRARFIEYYDFKKLMQGYLPLKINEQENSQQQFTIAQKGEFVGNGWNATRSGPSLNRYTADATDHRWVMENVPAFKNESYSAGSESYISKIDFQLVGTRWPGEGYKNLMGNWESVKDRYIQGEYFYSKVSGSHFLKKEMEMVLSGRNGLTDLEKIQALRNHIGTNVSWNGIRSRTTAKSLKGVFDDSKGTVAEINLILTSILQKAGFNAEPVLISTRDNGFVREQFPIVDQFNYVICRVVLDGKLYLLDATATYLPVGALPTRCLNGKGFVISPSGHSWVSLTPVIKRKTQLSVTAKIEDGQIKGDVMHKFEGYEAANVKSRYYRDSAEFKSDWLSNYQWEGNLKEVSGFTTSIPSVKSEMFMDLEESGGLIYLTPVLNPLWEKHPFKSEKRIYPVDFTTPISRTFYMTLELPNGYSVEEIPETKNIGLPAGGGTFRYTVSQSGTKLVILCKVDIKQTRFNPDQYPFIKAFFDNIMAQQESVIVLKKT